MRSSSRRALSSSFPPFCPKRRSERRDRQRVGHVPRPRGETEQPELRGRQRRIGRDVRQEPVHAVGERLQRHAALGGQLLELLLELGVGEAVTPGDDVAGQEARAEECDLRQPSLSGAPEELELDHPVLRRGVALGEPERSQLRGLAAAAGRDEDVRDTPLVSRDRDGCRVGRADDSGKQDGDCQGSDIAHGIPLAH